MAINAASDAEIELPDPLGLWELRARPATSRPAPSTYQQAVARAVVRVQTAAGEFFGRMDGRIQRDRRRPPRVLWRLASRGRAEETAGQSETRPGKDRFAEVARGLREVLRVVGEGGIPLFILHLAGTAQISAANRRNSETVCANPCRSNAPRYSSAVLGGFFRLSRWRLAATQTRGGARSIR